MQKPCPIPKTLKVGDVLDLRNGDTRKIEKVGHTTPDFKTVDFYDMEGDQFPLTYYPNVKGQHKSKNKEFDVMRIHRLRKPKDDADAKWLRSLAKHTTGPLPSEFSKTAKARLHKIAKRLENT